VDLSIIIVNYNGANFLDECIRSIFLTEPQVSFEVIVIDNASQDNSVAILENLPHPIRIIKNNENIGFAAANNQGAREAIGLRLFLLNNDTVVTPDAIDRLIEYFDSTPDLGVVSPMLLNADGSVQGHGSGLLTWLYRTSTPRFVAFVTGAAMMIRASVYAEVGGFDEAYFFYNEDVDLCKTLRKRGYKIAYCPDAKIFHFGGLSTSTRKAASVIEGYRGGLYLCQKHYGPLVYAIYSKAVLLDVIARWMVCVIKGIWNPSFQTLAAAYVEIMGIARRGEITRRRHFHAG